jgi:hypothetical protein
MKCASFGSNLCSSYEWVAMYREESFSHRGVRVSRRVRAGPGCPLWNESALSGFPQPFLPRGLSMAIYPLLQVWQSDHEVWNSVTTEVRRTGFSYDIYGARINVTFDRAGIYLWPVVNGNINMRQKYILSRHLAHQPRAERKELAASLLSSTTFPQSRSKVRFSWY